MVPASKAQQDAAQAAAAAKLPSTNGHSAPIEGLSIKQRADDISAEKSSRDKPSRGTFCPRIGIFTGCAHILPDTQPCVCCRASPLHQEINEDSRRRVQHSLKDAQSASYTTPLCGWAMTTCKLLAPLQVSVRGGTMTEEGATKMKREIGLVTDTTGGEMATETGTEIGTETEAGSETAATGIKAAAGSGGGMTEGQTGMATTGMAPVEEVRGRADPQSLFSPSAAHIRAHDACLCTARQCS